MCSRNPLEHVKYCNFYSQIPLLLLLLLHPFPKQEMMRWQWHQLDHMQIIYTSLQTDNHASTSPLSFYRPDALPAAEPTASKH